MVINLLDEILLIRLVDLFQRVVAFVRKVKTTSQYLIDSKGMQMQSTWNKGSWHVVDFIMKSQKFNVTSFILTEIDQARKKGFPQESSLCTTHHENDIEQESAQPASSFAPHF